MREVMKRLPRRFLYVQSLGRPPGVGTLCLLLAAACGGCRGGMVSGPRAEALDRFGRTYYLDGAGNWGYGVTGVRNGLRQAGYQGNIINFRWSPTFNPALDQTIGRLVLRDRARDLARDVHAYLQDHPGNDVNIIALSAGTGVAVWACEALEPSAKINNLILLGSSLSADYDMSKALSNISGAVWVYHSPNDAILVGPVRVLGTIDGRVVADSAGLIGLRPPLGYEDRIRNIGWTPEWYQRGWAGTHTDATNEPFVRHELAKHILREHVGATPHAATPPGNQVAQPTTQPAVRTVAAVG